MKAKQLLFSIDMKVRDYECDLQGVVNNANYLHYMEHCRHEWFESVGHNFGQMHLEGYDAFVREVKVIYKKSLRSGDRFRAGFTIRREGVKIIFDQYILFPDDSIAAYGEVVIVVVKDGQLTKGEFFDNYIASLLS